MRVWKIAAFGFPRRYSAAFGSIPARIAFGKSVKYRYDAWTVESWRWLQYNDLWTKRVRTSSDLILHGHLSVFDLALYRRGIFTTLFIPLYRARNPTMGTFTTPTRLPWLSKLVNKSLWMHVGDVRFNLTYRPPYGLYTFIQSLSRQRRDATEDSGERRMENGGRRTRAEIGGDAEGITLMRKARAKATPCSTLTSLCVRTDVDWWLVPPHRPLLFRMHKNSTPLIDCLAYVRLLITTLGGSWRNFYFLHSFLFFFILSKSIQIHMLNDLFIILSIR